MNVLERVVRARTGGGVERCHGIRHQGSYSVAAHSWGVAMLMYQLWPEDFPRLASYCLAHDVPEAWVGDIPAPTKKFSSEIKAACDLMERKIFERLELPCDQDLDPEDARKLKACDGLELYLWTCEQITAGNRHAECVARELEAWWDATPMPEEADDLFLAIREAGRIIEHGTDGWIREITK